MAPIISREDILTSATPPIGLVNEFSPELAILGHLAPVVSLLTTLDKHYPMHSLQSNLAPLRLAFAAANTWPAGYTAEHKDAEGLKELAEGCSDELWPEDVDEAKRTDDEAGLKVVLSTIATLEKQVKDDEGVEVGAEEEAISEGLVKALDIAIKVGGVEGKDELDERSEGILKKVAERLHKDGQKEALTQSARLWPFLLKGQLAKAVGVDESKVKKLGDDLVSGVQEWFEKGPQPSKMSKKSLKELLEICDVKTRENWPEDQDDHPKPKSLFAKAGAKSADIAALEKKLEAELPADYKEFLGLTDGFGRILSDDPFEAPFHAISEVGWLDAQEALKNVADMDDDDDEDEDEDEEADADGPPAKKMKMMDGNKLLAIAKQAEASRNGTKADKNDEGEDEDMDDDEDDAELQAALASGIAWPNILELHLLDLSDLTHESYCEESNVEWPEIEKVVEVAGDDGASLWLLPPSKVKEARDAYIKMYEAVDEEDKKTLRWAMKGFAGSEEAFRKYEGWAFLGFSGGEYAEADVSVWPSLRRYLEDMADNCEKLVNITDPEEAEKMQVCFAYRCR